jgi:hypothetical protein
VKNSHLLELYLILNKLTRPKKIYGYCSLEHIKGMPHKDTIIAHDPLFVSTINIFYFD